jgi:murein DD-endopeptidase MepM/ murein hydrolase activator NlpD
MDGWMRVRPAGRRIRFSRLTRRGVVVVLLAAVAGGCGSTAPYRVSGQHRDAAERLAERHFLWPVRGTVSSGFGRRGTGWHHGLDILAPAGTEVCATEAGVAVYAGNGMRGYGNAVVLDHGDGVTSLYGHLRSIRVKSADAVAAGGLIGTVGRTGNATTDHLHFELRVDDHAVDPSPYLSP